MEGDAEDFSLRSNWLPLLGTFQHKLESTGGFGLPVSLTMLGNTGEGGVRMEWSQLL